MDQTTLVKYLSNLAVDSLIWIIIVFLFTALFWKIPKAIYITYKLLEKNRATMGNSIGYHSADIFINTWYTLYGIPQADKNRFYYSPISFRDINQNYDFYIKLFLKYDLIFKDVSDDRYKVVRSWRNKVIVMILKFWLIFIVGDNSNYYRSLCSQLNGHKSKS